MLIARREDLGLTREKVAETLSINPKSYARFERGETNLRVGRRPALAKILKWSPEELRLALGDGSQPSVSNGQLVPEWLNLYVTLEQSATLVRSYQPHVIHGLLQTAAYARLLVEESNYAQRGGDRVDRLVELRMKRQVALRRANCPLRLSLIMSETALRTQVGDRETMHHQLEHVVDMAALPNITVQVLPFTAGPHTAMLGPISLLTLPWCTTPSSAYIESYLSGASHIESPYEVHNFEVLLDHLSCKALPEVESIEMIRRIAKEHVNDD